MGKLTDALEHDNHEPRQKAEQPTWSGIQALSQAKQQKQRLIKKAKRIGCLRRAAIKLIGRGRIEKSYYTPKQAKL
jgi:hypothetical protein